MPTGSNPVQAVKNDMLILLNNILLAFFTIVCGYVSYKLLRYHVDLILFPWPIQYRETANLLSTDLLLKGGNPYSLENQPVYTNVYGLLYNIATYPFAAVFGPTLFSHKAVGGFFTLCNCSLVYGMLRKDKVSRLLAWGGALVVYISLLFSKTSLAEPDSLGLFLYLLTIALPMTFNFSNGSLVGSSLSAIAAFYTKPYFILALPFVCLYTFAFVSRRKGTIYLLMSMLFFILPLVTVNALFETYFYNTFLIHQNVAGTKTDWMIMQWSMFGNHFRELLSAAVAVCAALLCDKIQNKYKLDLPPNEHDNMYCVRKTTLPFFTMLSVSLVFSVKLGLHTGAYMTYLFQLVSPLFVLSLFPHLGREKGWQFIFLPLLAANLLQTSGIYQDINEDFRHFDDGNWQSAQNYVSTHRNILNSAAIAPLLLAQGKPVYDSGQSEYFQIPQIIPPPVNFFFPPLKKVKIQSLKFKQEIETGIIEKRFDLLMLDRSFSSWIAPKNLISQNYTHRDVLTLYMPHTKYLWRLDIWEPKR